MTSKKNEVGDGPENKLLDVKKENVHWADAKRYCIFLCMMLVMGTYFFVFYWSNMSHESFYLLKALNHVGEELDTDRRVNRNLSMKDFTKFMFEKMSEYDVFKHNEHFKILSIYQTRFEVDECHSDSKPVKEYLMRNIIDTCYPPKSVSDKSYGSKTGGFLYKEAPTKSFTLAGR